MDCACGDPSCGYCQAARGVNSDFYSFDDFVPMDPFDMSLTTILEEDETVDDLDGDEENQHDSDQDIIEEEEVNGRATEWTSIDQINQLQMSEYSRAGPSHASPFGDYDGPSDEPLPKYSKMTPLFSPSFEFSKLHLVGNGSTESASTGSDDSDDEMREKSEQLSQLESLFKESMFRFNEIPGIRSPTDDLVSEDEKKRLRNTEAARRCREKIKRKTEDLEQQLTHLTSHNDLMNQHRICLLSQVKEQMRTLDMLKRRNPAMGAAISYEAKKIVDTYTQQVEGKRKAIREFFERSCNKSY